MTYRGEAEDDVKVLACTGQEVLVEVLVGGWTTWKFLLHDRHKFLLDLVHLITCKQVGHLQTILGYNHEFPGYIQ